ncbi:MAG: hypothetical protein H6868_07085 [Rhodospirillales bacterium]|nr:hypothetical protein [Rhodospirillales bacterium]
MRDGMKAFTAFVFCTVMFGMTAAFAAEEAGHEAAGAAHGGDHASSAGMPQFDVTTYPSQIFWLTVTFLILYVFFSSRILPDISGVLENRQEHINGDLKTAERLKKEAEEALLSYEGSLNAARTEAAAITQAMHGDLKKKADQETRRFQEKAASEMLSMEKRLVKAREQAIEEMDDLVASVASEAAHKIVGIDQDLKKASKVVKTLSKKEAA